MRFQVTKCALLAPLIAISTAVLAEESLTIPLTREDLVRSCELAQQNLAIESNAYVSAVANSSEVDQRILAMQADLNRIRHSLVTSLQIAEIRSRYGIPATDTVERFLTHTIYTARQQSSARSNTLALQFLDISGQQVACQQQCGAAIELEHRINTQDSPVHARLTPEEMLAQVGAAVAQRCPMIQANSRAFSAIEMQRLMDGRRAAIAADLEGAIAFPILVNNESNWLNNIFSFSSSNRETCTGLTGEQAERCRNKPRLNFQGVRGSALASAITGGNGNVDTGNWFQRVATCASWNVEFQRDEAEVVSGFHRPESYEVTVTLTWRTNTAILEPLTGRCVAR